MPSTPHRRRSVLYIPCSKPKALSKAFTLETDVVFFDLEDSVDVDQKVAARENLMSRLATTHNVSQEIVVRVNHLDTPWGYDDVKALADLPIDGLCIPKVESTQLVNNVIALFGKDIPIWVNIETPTGILHVNQISALESVTALVMGTNDLSAAMQLRHPTNQTFHYAYSACIMAGKAYQKTIIDGVYNAFKDDEGFKKACDFAVEMGFDGKSLIHPSQIPLANDAFSPTKAELAEAQALINAWDNRDQSQGIAVHEGQIVEELHVDYARYLISLAKE